MIGKKEAVSIEGFPEITTVRPKKSRGVVSVKGLVESHYTKQTEFSHGVVTFGNFFERMKGIVPPSKRWGRGQPIPEEVSLFPSELAMDNLTKIANTEGTYGDMGLKKDYRKNLRVVLRTIKASKIFKPKATRVAVKRAGVVAAEFLHGPGAALVYEAKRLPFIDGTLGVGMDDQEKVLTPESLDGKEVEIDEVFLASGSTILAFIIDCYSRGIKPESLVVVTPFVAQQGAKAVLALSSQIGWEVKILAARIYYWLNDHWYVLVTPQERVWRKISGGDLKKEVQAGGDAGDLTELSPIL